MLIHFSPLFWPPRVAASEIAYQFDFQSPFQSYDVSFFDLQYVTPFQYVTINYKDILIIIVASDIPRMSNVIDKCLAASFPCDA